MTNPEIIPELANINTTAERRNILITQFLNNDPIYNKLAEPGRASVRNGIQEELHKIDKNNMMDDKGIAEYKAWFLNIRVPKFLENMLHGQVANEKLNLKRAARKAEKSPLEFAERKDPQNSR